ncbi:hypothetical protein KNE206_07490 [Kitasatospora sp. NE20-6]
MSHTDRAVVTVANAQSAITETTGTMSRATIRARTVRGRSEGRPVRGAGGRGRGLFVAGVRPAVPAGRVARSARSAPGAAGAGRRRGARGAAAYSHGWVLSAASGRVVVGAGAGRPPVPGGRVVSGPGAADGQAARSSSAGARSSMASSPASR